MGIEAPEMGFNEYQDWAAGMAIYPKQAGIAYSLLGLVDEVGEVCMSAYNRLLALERSCQDSPLFAILANVLSSAAKTGEIAGKSKKAIRDGAGLSEADTRFCVALTTEMRKPENAKPFVKELGDSLWYVSDNVRNVEYSLQAVVDINTKKLNSRKERGVLGGSGDNR